MCLDACNLNVRVSFARGRNHSSVLPRPSSLRLHFGEGPFKILLSTRSGHLLSPEETPEYLAPLWVWFRIYMIFHKREYDLSHCALIYSSHVDHVIYQTRETVFYWGIQTPTRELKIRRASEYFCRNSRCWIADETLSLVLNISSQSKKTTKTTNK